MERMTPCIHCGKLRDAECHKSRQALGGAPRMDSHEYVRSVDVTGACGDVTTICSVCGEPTEPHAPGVEPLCRACFCGTECACMAGAESICGSCGEPICGGDACLLVHGHRFPVVPS